MGTATQAGRFIIELTPRSFAFALVFAAAFAFSIGTTFRVALVTVRANRAIVRLCSSNIIPDAMMHEQRGHTKVLFSDATVQRSSPHDEEDIAHGEALVHPAMIAHVHPKRVAIVGTRESSATLRETLKHRTVEDVVMVDIEEEEWVQSCRERPPEWSDCRDLEGSDADSCLDDSRVRLAFGDALRWFGDRFGKEENEEDGFDVIIMDSSDADRFVAIDGGLYKEQKFADSLYNGLTEDGVFVVQLGESNALLDTTTEIGPARDTANMMKALQNAGFESMHVYDEGHGHFGQPRSYLVCLKDSESRARWYQTAAEINIELHRRIYKSKSGKPALLHFDAPTMIGYQLPSKAQETAYCRTRDEMSDCDELLGGIDPGMMNAPMSHLEARKSTIRNGGRGLFAARDIPRGASILMDQAVQSFHIFPLTWYVIEGLYEWADESDDGIPSVEAELSGLYTFAEGYGFRSTLLGKKHFTVDSGISAFCNHGCNGTYTFADDGVDFSEMNVDLDHLPEILELEKTLVFSPVLERHLRQSLAMGDKALVGIKKGEEVFCNYLSFVGDPDDWEEEVGALRSQCAGEAMGEILQYELKVDEEIHQSDDDVVMMSHNYSMGCV